MKKLYILSALLSLAMFQPSQASIFKSTEESPSEVAYTTPSWKQDITKHYILWTFSPSISSLLYVVNMIFDFLPDDANDYLVRMAVVSLLVYGILAFVLASWSGIWRIEGKEKSSDIPPFSSRLWRGIRFLFFTGLLPSIITGLTLFGYLNKVFPSLSMNIRFFLMLWGYPCLVAGIIAVCLIGYNFFTQGAASDKKKKSTKEAKKNNKKGLFAW